MRLRAGHKTQNTSPPHRTCLRRPGVDTNAALSRAAFWRRPEHVAGAQLLVKKLRREIRTVGPDNGPKLFVQRKLRKSRLVLQGLEYFSPQLGFKIDFTFNAIGKFQPDAVIAPVFRFS